MKRVLCLAILFTSALWAAEAADRAGVEATIFALNTSPRPELFTADFPNAAELQRFQGQFLVLGGGIQINAGTLVISREPMGEATWIPGTAVTAVTPRFVTRSVTFVSPDTAIVVAAYGQESVLFVVKNEVKNESSNWRIASFRVLPEAQTKAVL